MERENLRIEILDKLEILNNRLTKEEKRAFHFKSLVNFIYYIFKDEAGNIPTSKLKNINLHRNQRFILEYLNLILTSEVSIKDSEMLYKEHINSIGAFMSEYFGFVLVGGKTKYFYLLSNIAIGIVLDLLISFILQKFLLIFSIFFLLYSIIRIVIKQKNKKIYGPNY